MSIKNKRFTGGITIEKVTDRTKGLSIDTTDASSNYTVATPDTGVGDFTIDLPDSGSTILSDENTATNLIDGATLENVIIVDPILDIQDITLSEMAAPSAPDAGKATLYLDSTSKELTLKDSDNNTTSFVKQATSSANIVYGTDVSENETTIGYSASSSSDKIIQRDSNASAKIDILSDSDMSADGSDITNRSYVRRKVIVDSNDTAATEGGSLSISTNTNSNVYYINANSDLNSYTITLPDLKDNVDNNKAYEYCFIFQTTINSLTVSASGGSSLNFFINHAQAGDSFSVVFDNDNNLWYLKDQYSRNLNDVQSEHIAVRLLDGTETTLPTGTVTVDGQSVIVEDVVLFTNLSSDPGVYRAKGTIGDNTITGWDQVSCFRGVDSPIAGDEVFVRAGTVYANTLHTYDGSSWSDTSTDKADTDLGNLTSTSINQDLLPDTTLTRDLGSSSKSWVDVWVERLLAPLGSTVTVATENATSSTNSNNVTVTSGSTVDGTSGQMTAKSGDTSGNGSSNFATFRSGNITGTTSSGNSGVTTVRSGNVSGASSTGDSGNVVVKSGDVSGSGDSGNVAVYSGSSAGGSRGAVSLQGNGILLDSLGQGVDVDNDNIINVADPVNAQDAATKNYTDTLVENPTIEVATFDGQSSTPTNPSAGNYKVYIDDNTKKLSILDENGTVTPIGSGSGGGVNFIDNPDAEAGTLGWELYSDRLSMSNVDVLGDAMDFVVNGATQGSTPAVGTRIRYMGSVANGNMSLNTDYYVSTAPIGAGTTSNPWTFGVSTTSGGSTIDITSTAGLNNSDFYPYAPLMGYGNLAVPDITFSVNSTNPLSGNQDFLFSKPASNCLGEGVSYDFTIDRARQGKVLQISFDYKNSSAFATGDLTVYIYDKTNNVIIEPVGHIIQAHGLPSMSHVASFQTAIDSLDYRLIFHVASTNASAWDFEFDNVSVSPGLVSSQGVVTGRFNISASQTGVNPNNSFVKLNLNQVVFQSEGLLNAANNRLVVQTPGTYDIDAIAFFNTTNVLNLNYVLHIYINGVSAAQGGSNYPPTSGWLTPDCYSRFQLKANDYVEFYLFGAGNNSSNTLTLGNIRVTLESVPTNNASPAYGTNTPAVFRVAGVTPTLPTLDSNYTSIVFGGSPSINTLGFPYNGTKITITKPGWYVAKVSSPITLSRSSAGSATYRGYFLGTSGKSSYLIESKQYYTSGGQFFSGSYQTEAFYAVSNQEIEYRLAVDGVSSAAYSYINVASLSLHEVPAPVTSLAPGKMKKYQTKYLPSNITNTNTNPISSLTFNNLTIGKNYRVTLSISAVAQNNGDNIFLQAVHNSVPVCRQIATVPNEGPADRVQVNGSGAIFTASATTVTFQVSFSGGGVLEGNGSSSYTWAMLEECDDMIPTTDWN